MFMKVAFLLLGCFLLIQESESQIIEKIFCSGLPIHYQDPINKMYKHCLLFPHQQKCLCFGAWHKYCWPKPKHPLCNCIAWGSWWSW